jgi:ADP-ribose pyrophosphatase YjhB (NUDIX family)
VDAIISLEPGQVILIERLNPPLGWALPGGFVETGETTEQAVKREAKEEVELDISLLGLLGVYSDPGRDLRRHTLSIVYIAKADQQTPKSGSDAGNWQSFTLDTLPANICFDHRQMLDHYKEYLRGERYVCPILEI